MLIYSFDFVGVFVIFWSLAANWVLTDPDFLWARRLSWGFCDVSSAILVVFGTYFGRFSAISDFFRLFLTFFAAIFDVFSAISDVFFGYFWRFLAIFDVFGTYFGRFFGYFWRFFRLF